MPAGEVIDDAALEREYESWLGSGRNRFEPIQPVEFKNSWIAMKRKELRDGGFTFEEALQILKNTYEDGKVPEGDMFAFGLVP